MIQSSSCPQWQLDRPGPAGDHDGLAVVTPLTGTRSDGCARCGTAKLTICQLTRESRRNGSGLRPRVWLASERLLGQLDPGWNLTIGRRSQFLLVLGHEAHPKTTLFG